MEREQSGNMDNSTEQMQQLRELVLGKDNSRVTDTVRESARDIVGEVFSEALHDRQQKDGSVNQVLLPLVEKSVEKSVNSHSEQFVGYLYPLVGRLVRKSVSAFVNDFLEKTNELIENSLTIKGLKWRFKAWRTGVSFSQYVASQTFVFRVEQVLLIHRKTGLLLNSVSIGQQAAADADMVSGMLTAINDFVSDSFHADTPQSEQQLDVVKTDNFTLLIKPGPQAILVAAVSGNAPSDLGGQLQDSIEYIHSVYGKELSEFEGDSVPFENTEQELRECLVSQLKPEISEQKKTPWMALLLVLVVFILMMVYAFSWWQQKQLVDKLVLLEQQPGIVIQDLNMIDNGRVHLDVLRDPAAKSIQAWLVEQAIPAQKVEVVERSFLSLAPELQQSRLAHIVEQYPQLQLTWDQDTPYISGRLQQRQKQALAEAIAGVPGLSDQGQMLEQVEVIELDNQADDNPAILKALLNLSVAKVDRTQIEFEVGQSGLNDAALARLESLSEEFKTAANLAKQLNLNIGLIIMGASDPSGNQQFNQTLSLNRARQVQRNLVGFGIEPGYLNAIGLGVVADKTTGTGARKVLFSVVYFDAEPGSD